MGSARRVVVGVLIALSGGALWATPRVAALDPPKSVGELQLKAEQMHRHMREQLEHAQHLQAMARADKDYIKLSCIDRGVIDAAQLVEMSSQATASLERATHAGDRDAQAAMLGKIAFAADETDRTVQEVSACLGAREVRVADRSESKPPPIEIKRTEPEYDEPNKPLPPQAHDGAKPARAQHDGGFGDPLRDASCRDLGTYYCSTQPLEYLGYASPFAPN